MDEKVENEIEEAVEKMEKQEAEVEESRAFEEAQRVAESATIPDPETQEEELPHYIVTGYADCPFRIAHSKQCTYPRQSSDGSGELGPCIITDLDSPCPPGNCPLIQSDVMVQLILP